LDDNKEIMVAEIKVAAIENNTEQKEELSAAKKNKGKLLMDATVAPQNITFPTRFKIAKCRPQKERGTD